MLNKKGFTLIEVVTVMGIMALLLGLILVNFNQGKYTQELREASQNLVTDLRDMQNTTLIGRTAGVCHSYDDSDVLQSVTVDCNQDSQCTPMIVSAGWSYLCEDVVPSGGYGLYFDPSQPEQYTFFGDYGSDLRNGILTPNEYSYEGLNFTDVYVRTVYFSDYIKVKDIKGDAQFSLDGCPDAKIPPEKTYWTDDSSPISLIFTQPRGALYTTFHTLIGLKDSCPDYLISILLEHDRIDACRLVTINGASGLIEEESNPTCTL